jgi:tRNA-specific 2-thiouridylase
MAGKQVSVKFDAPVRDVTTGQAAVFYQGEVMLGGGIIA